jgi:hypothetical protein
MSFQPRRSGIPLDQIVRPKLLLESTVPAGVPLNPDARIISSVQVILQTSASGERCLAVYTNDTGATLFEGHRLHSHEDLYRLGLRWHDAMLFGPSGVPLGTSDDETLRNHLVKEYAVTVHSIGAKAAWQAATLGAVLEGLRQMAHALETYASIESRQSTLLSPIELIRKAPWGRLLATGFDQPAIGRWHPAGGLVYSDTGSSWQALAPLKSTTA